MSARQAFAAAAIYIAMPALAQAPPTRIAIESIVPSTQGGLTRVSTAINFNLPGLVSASDDMQVLRERARSLAQNVTLLRNDLADKLFPVEQRLTSSHGDITASRKPVEAGTRQDVDG